MSLHGLDDPKVQEAHEAAVAEPGGWFLLKYASRDEVELLGRGNGGIVEVRNRIAEYEETSPLYGFLRYRRRNVLIKYQPDDCSRLIQARATVHFNAICEHFSPYDTTFDITAAKELSDTKLSAACSLHAASGSNSSSSSSLRRRRLMEIAEEEEEEQRAPKRQSVVPEDDERPQTPEPQQDTVTLNSQLGSSPEHTNFTAASTAEVPNFVGVDDRPMSPPESIDAARRNSSQSARPDLFSYSSYPYTKPKVKLGPRPSLDVNGRPRTAGAFRPVSQIPAGFKMHSKGSRKGRNKDGETPSPPTAASEDTFSSPMSIPEEPVRNVRPATSSGVSTISTIMSPTPVPMLPVTPVKPTMTPEKARLMKAMKLREKKKKKMALKESSTAPEPDIQSPAPSEETLGDKTDGDDATIEDPNGDSGIVLEASSSSMNTDSHPASPVMESSEPDQSTKASSLSESTDETVQAKGEDSHEKEESEDEEVDEKTPTLAESKPEVSVTEITVSEAEEDHDGTSDEEREAEALLEEFEAAPAPKEETTPSEDVSAEKPDELIAEPVAADAATEEPSNVPVSLSKDAEDETVPSQVPDPAETKETPVAEEEEEDEEDDQVEPLSPVEAPLMIPKSKFSTQDLRSIDTSGAPAMSSPRSDRSRSLRASPVIVTEEVFPERKEDSSTRQVNEPESELEHESELKQPKRKAFVEPIRTDFEGTSRPVSAHISDDESLMEELQSATFQEAKPILVAKSPVTPVFPSPTKGGSIASHMVRTVSNPVRGTLLSPADVNQTAASRSLSSGAAYLHKVTQQQQTGANLSKKTNMGSSISQRIKALEKLSAGQETPVVPVTTRERPSSTFFSVRKGREPSRSPSVIDRASTFTMQPPPSRAGSSRDVSPDMARHVRRERSGSVASRLSMFEPPVVIESSPRAGSSPRAVSRGRPESISVTAKIIRDPNYSAGRTMEPPKDPSEYAHLELRQSPLLVDHQRAAPPQWTPLANETKETIQERRMSKESRRSESRDYGKDAEKSRRSSLSIVKDFIKERRKSLTSPPPSDVLVTLASPGSRPPSAQQPSSTTATFSHRLSISSRRSSFTKDREMVISPGATTEGSSGDETRSNTDKKKSSRAGRFMRRLSTLSTGRGKISTSTPISPTVAEEPAPEAPAASSTPTIVSYMGDVNVQFPDTLLWKRRNMCLDSQGFLILSALPGGSSNRPAQQGTKRYHLSEFRTPCVPDVEVQELPNSVVLDLIEGSGVQVACEDRAGQLNVLKILQEAHAAHATFGQ